METFSITQQHLESINKAKVSEQSQAKHQNEAPFYF